MVFLVFLLDFVCFLVLDPPCQGLLVVGGVGLRTVDPDVDLLETVDAVDAVDAAEAGLESIPKGSDCIGSDFGIVKGTNSGRVLCSSINLAASKFSALVLGTRLESSPPLCFLVLPAFIVFLALLIRAPISTDSSYF